jgi:UDP-N-acetylmuramoyl-L-alanyl-D-glutamate--2,6-diaminopimelate ligase
MTTQPGVARAWRLADLLDGFAEVGRGGDLAVGDIAADSRQVVPGALFLACAGPTHGLTFAAHARDRGAVAVAAEPTHEWDDATLGDTAARLGLPVIPVPGLAAVVGALADRFYGAPSAAMEVIGVGGISGKNSVSHFLAQTLALEAHCAYLGTIGTGFPGDPNPLAPLGEAPGATGHYDAVQLQDALARLRARGAQAVAMALSTDSVARGCIGAVRFRHAVFTNLGGGPAGQAEPAAVVPDAAPLYGSPGLRWAVFNADDPGSGRLIARLGPGSRVALYGQCPRPPAGWGHDLWVGLCALTPLRGGMRLGVRADGPTGSEEGEVEVRVLGTFNAANLLAVLALLLARGLTLDPALRALARVRGVPGRMERFGGEDAPLVAVDAAHTPDALDRAMAALRRHGTGRLITVFGCAGGLNGSQHPLMGAAAEAGSDLVIVTDDNPRGEDGDAIVAGILSGMRRAERARVERRRGQAIRIALTLAGRGDSVLVAGKGHETTQDLGELKVRYSDRAQVVQVLREWKGRDQATVCAPQGSGSPGRRQEPGWGDWTGGRH